MRIVSYTEARNGLKAVLDGVEADADIAVITRRDGADAVVGRSRYAEQARSPSQDVIRMVMSSILSA